MRLTISLVEELRVYPIAWQAEVAAQLMAPSPPVAGVDSVDQV
jgi:hypothetical protein